ncbi:alpha/beta-hydrolase [Aspergillus sclerotioniger CBS 115572]|uniref:Alpha/beta-hydrolase n=1 Tax=Aspergillus sclerotioniger CBS 115572 TaxID=1450535 RepID=A0A317WBM1_9EURO|nr:alpha/beta-hydrolase [Aspergillus sclerotioniger CBS 115572]PWY83906.1 alpha/beta-hydrolase [Aspergillus sclerotioniger CBS 115572]
MKFSSKFFNFEFLRVLGTAPLQGADVAECMDAASQIQDNDPDSWHHAWSRAAEKAEAMGEEARRSGDRQTAVWAYLRASNYHRSSEFMLHHLPRSIPDTRSSSSLNHAIRSFRHACQLMDSPVEFVDIPYQHAGTTHHLPGYLFLPVQSSITDASTGVPVVFTTGGFDSIQEELYYYAASGARTRGYATLSFEGPGQGIMLHRDEHHLYLRPDWEVVIKAVLDWLFATSAAHPEWNLDLSRLALFGASMGGYFALRGATDPRVKACIAVDPFYDLATPLRARMPAWLMSAIEHGYLSDRLFNGLFRMLATLNFQTRWEFGHGMRALGIDSPAVLVREFTRYTLHPVSGTGSPLEHIECPVLVTGARESMYFPPESSAVPIYEVLRRRSDASTDLWLPEGVGQGGLQAKVGGLSHLHAKVFGWLDHVFGMDRSIGRSAVV